MVKWRGHTIHKTKVVKKSLEADWTELEEEVEFDLKGDQPR